jgi:hypothetical protein
VVRFGMGNNSCSALNIQRNHYGWNIQDDGTPAKIQPEL